RTSICLILGVQLIEYIGINHCIGDFDGLLSVTRAKINFHHITCADTSNVELLLDCKQRFSSALGVRFGFGSLPSETGDASVKSVKQVINQPVAGIDKLGILSKAQLFDHICCNI